MRTKIEYKLHWLHQVTSWLLIIIYFNLGRQIEKIINNNKVSQSQCTTYLLTRVLALNESWQFLYGKKVNNINKHPYLLINKTVSKSQEPNPI